MITALSFATTSLDDCNHPVLELFRLSHHAHIIGWWMVLPLSTAHAQGGERRIAYGYAPLFLAGTSLKSVKGPEARSVLAAFLSEARDVLAEYFGLTERSEMEVIGSIV